jgi:hypothetical protein
MNKLRDALGDSASNARFVETLPRRGYRFIAPAEFPEASLPPVPPAQPPSKNSLRVKVIAAATALVLLLAAAALGTRSFLETRRDATLQITPLTSAPGMEIQPSFSPDGNYVVYSGQPTGSGNWALYVKPSTTSGAKLEWNAHLHLGGPQISWRGSA